MKESLWMYFFMTMGILGIVLINVFGQIIINNEQGYYLLKETTEAAMIDAVDLKAFRDGVGWDGVTELSDSTSMHCMEGIPGTIRIIKEKFVESFVRRFSMSAQLSRKYRIIINDIDECPPKVSITLVTSEQFSFLNWVNVRYDSGADIVNTLNAILENVTPDKYE